MPTDPHDKRRELIIAKLQGLERHGLVTSWASEPGSRSFEITTASGRRFTARTLYAAEAYCHALYSAKRAHRPHLHALDRIAEILRNPQRDPAMLDDIAALLAPAGRKTDPYPDGRVTWPGPVVPQ